MKLIKQTLVVIAAILLWIFCLVLITVLCNFLPNPFGSVMGLGTCFAFGYFAGTPYIRYVKGILKKY